MSKIFKIPAEMRADVGKGASRRLRRAGRVPAVVYGGNREPATITLDHDTVRHMADEEAFFSSVLELNVAKKRQKVVIRDLQRHPFKPLLTHIDFLRVSDDQAIRLNVPIHFINEETSPAGKKGGVVISHQTTEVEISALPGNLPEYLEVDLAELEPGDSVMLSQIQLPEGVTIPALALEGDHDHPLVTALFIRASQGTGELAAEADAALGQAAEVETVSEAEESDEESEGEEGESEGEDEAKKDD